MSLVPQGRTPALPPASSGATYGFQPCQKGQKGRAQTDCVRKGLGSHETLLAGHFLYIWAAFSGRLEKVLEARASSAALALAAHPQRHLLAAATAIGQVVNVG